MLWLLASLHVVAHYLYWGTASIPWRPRPAPRAHAVADRERAPGETAPNVAEGVSRLIGMPGATIAFFGVQPAVTGRSRAAAARSDKCAERKHVRSVVGVALRQPVHP